VHGFEAMQKDANFISIIIDMSAHGSKTLNNGKQGSVPEPCQHSCSLWESLKVEVHGFEAIQKDANFTSIIIDMSAYGSKPLPLAFRALYLNPANIPSRCGKC
jgi:hypothetical protein